MPVSKLRLSTTKPSASTVSVTTRSSSAPLRTSKPMRCTGSSKVISMPTSPWPRLFRARPPEGPKVRGTGSSKMPQPLPLVSWKFTPRKAYWLVTGATPSSKVISVASAVNWLGWVSWVTCAEAAPARVRRAMGQTTRLVTVENMGGPIFRGGERIGRSVGERPLSSNTTEGSS